MIQKLVKWKISGRFPAHPRKSIRENFNSNDYPLHQIFPKTISPKNFSGEHDKRTVRDLPKMPHRTFREDSCIQSSPHAADPENRNEKTAQPFNQVRVGPPGNFSHTVSNLHRELPVNPFL